MDHARLAVSVLFFVNGAVLASWLPHIPAVKARLTSGDGQLGLVLLAMAGGPWWRFRRRGGSSGGSAAAR